MVNNKRYIINVNFETNGEENNINITNVDKKNCRNSFDALKRQRTYVFTKRLSKY